MGEYLYKLTCVTLFIVCIAGCSGSSGNSSVGDSDPLDDQELSGVWLGYFINTTGVDPCLKTAFTVGIVTEDGQARFIGDDTQFIADGVDRSLAIASRWTLLGQYVHGELDACTWDWDTTGVAADYECFSELVDDISGGVFTQTSLWGLYERGEESYRGVFSLTYNTTYGVSPNVEALGGPWVANNVFEHGNTLTLTITPDAENTTNGTIAGSDNIGNTFSGVIEIHYSVDAEDTENVYDVTLIFGGTEMTGLATYVQERTTEGVEAFKKILAIGVASDDLSRMISVLSTLGN